jgi:hypothetical protein
VRFGRSSFRAFVFASLLTSMRRRVPMMRSLLSTESAAPHPPSPPTTGGEDKGEGVIVFTAKARRAQSKEFLINKYSLGELGGSAVK